MSAPASDGTDRTELTVTIRFRTTAVVEYAEVKQLAAELAAASQSEPGCLTYAWEVGEDRTSWTIDESYRDEDALVAHLAHLKDTGLLRRMAKTVRIGELAVLSGDPVSVSAKLGVPLSK